MSKSTRGIRVAGIASLAVSLSLGVAAPAFAVADFKFDRIGGADRYETSTLVDDEFRDGGADVILANGQPGNYADALSANTLAGEKNIPILLTRKDDTPASVLQQLKDDGVKNIWVVGGTSVVSDAQVASLTAAGYTVTRVSGADRFGTNNEIIKMSGAAAGNTGLVATGFNFPDALAAGPFSFQGHPLALSTKDSIEDSTVQALKDAGVTKVLIFGGTTVVTPAVEAKLKAAGIDTAARFAGADRSDTSEQAAEYAVKNLGFTNTHVGVASGYVKGFGADALAGGPLEGKEKSPMLVTRDVDNPDDVLDYLKAHAATLKDGHIYGGTAAVSAAAQAAMEKAAQSATSNQSLSVTPSEKATNIVSSGATNNGGARTYTVSGLDGTKTYDIELHEAEDVVKDASGQVKFQNNTPIADNTGVSIESVNGAVIVPAATAAGESEVHNVTPVNGSITFTIDSVARDRVVPVVNADADGDNTLDLAAGTAPTAPTEAFGIGGEKEWIPVEASGGGFTVNNGDVKSVNKTGDYFVADPATGADAAAGDVTYYYDANDQFRIAGTPVTLATFESNLSSGDGFNASTYAPDAAATSTFDLADAAPAAPGAAPTFTEVGPTSVKVTSAAVTGADQYVFLRSTTSGGPYTEVGRSATVDFKDTGLAPNTAYYYVTRAVIDGDESANSAQGTVTTATADSTVRPLIIDARLTTDGGLQGRVDDTDVWKLVFNKDMSATTETGGRFILKDASGDDVEIDCATLAADCTLNGGSETVGTTAYSANRVLTITVNTITGGATVTDTSPVDGVTYPLNLLTTDADVKDTSGNIVNVADSTDKVIDSE